VLKINITTKHWTSEFVEVPHAPFEDVFYLQDFSKKIEIDESIFIKGLADLESIKTTGAGLINFIEATKESFRPEVIEDIYVLLEEVQQNDKNGFSRCRF